MQKGRVLYGINNLFTLETSAGIVEARIKGKHLKGVTNEYNVLASGDFVQLDESGQITARLERKNLFARFNWKQYRPQALAANLDYLFCVVAVDSPPLHVRFLDRLLIAAHAGNIEPWIILTKTDLLKADAPDPLEYYHKMGYRISYTNCDDPSSIASLREQTQGAQVGLVGASGVGKSTLINNLLQEEKQKTGAVNRKFNKGNHTTNYAIIIKRAEGGSWVDTPGVRDLSPVLHASLHSYYPDFQEYQGLCSFHSCTHGDEPGCAIREAVESGRILEDRYVNYCKLLAEEALKTQKTSRYKT